jgi:ABC-type Fe3+-hydroxamate transport system substrate-binding protein
MDKFARFWTDAGGVQHDPARAMRRQRIVSLVPSLTETLCVLGGQSRLAGCTAFCVHPSGLLKDANIRKVGGTKTVLRDKVLDLKPDLILMNLEENTLEDIAFFRDRVECYIDGTKTLEDGLQSIIHLGALIGEHAKAMELHAQGSEVMAKVSGARTEALKEGRSAPTVFYAIWREPWMSVNRDTFIHDMLTRCGARNVFADREKRYPEVSWEEILAANPDVVWLSSEPYRFKEKHLAEWSNPGPAEKARNQRVELVDGEQVCWFGVRQIAGMEYTFDRLWKT